MTNSLIVRDFTKVYRELRFQNEGSFRLSEIEHNAYLNRLTLEVTHYDAYRSVSYKTNPDNTHWGYCTTFKGSSVSQNIPVKFAKQRVFECINQGIWAYHQETENVRLTKSFTESTANSILQSDLLSETQKTIVDFYLDLIGNLPDQIDEDLQWILSFTYRPDPPPQSGNKSYTAFPLASPFPDIFKFKGDVPLSFLFRLESWYLVNPAVYIVANPTDTGDATEDEEEYPEPVGPTGEGGNVPGSGSVPFPTPDLPQEGNDPRDYGNFGVDVPVLIEITYTVNAWQAGCVPYTDVRKIVLPYERSLAYSLDKISTTNTSTCQANPAPVGLRLIHPQGGITVLEGAGTEMRGASTIDGFKIVEQA